MNNKDLTRDLENNYNKGIKEINIIKEKYLGNIKPVSIFNKNKKKSKEDKIKFFKIYFLGNKGISIPELGNKFRNIIKIGLDLSEHKELLMKHNPKLWEKHNNTKQLIPRTGLSMFEAEKILIKYNWNLSDTINELKYNKSLSYDFQYKQQDFDYFLSLYFGKKYGNILFIIFIISILFILGYRIFYLEKKYPNMSNNNIDLKLI